MFLVDLARRMLYAMRSILLPFKFFGKLVKKIKIPPWARYSLELTLVVVVVIGFALLNWALGLEKHLAGSGPLVLRKVWLGILALLVYLAIRLFIFIIQQLPGKAQEFPDIDDAIDAGLEALHDARVDLRDSPVYLAIGLQPDQERGLLESPLVSNDVRVVDSDLPVHWMGGDRALWVSLPGVSALSHQVKVASRRGGRRATSPPPTAQDTNVGATQGSSRFATMAGEGRFATLGAIDTDEGTDPGASDPVAPEPDKGYRSAQRISADERELDRQRVEYFVERLRELRYPVCPVNGLMVALPFSWSSSPGLSQLADSAKLDMEVLEQGLGVKCFSIAVFTGIEESEDFTAYVERLAAKEVERRCGCSFPPLVEPERADFDSAHHWLLDYFERQVYKLFRDGLGHPSNGKLFRLLETLRKSRSNFVRILTNAFPQDVADPFYFGGVYFAGMGDVGSVSRPFIDGVIAKVHRESDDVIGWNQDAIARDQRYTRLSRTVIGVVVVLTILCALLILSMVLGW
ncbi:hypothetical protein Pan216_23870 [Planctomycetes bacterium Pan216]|uniref:Type VI secretion system component TssM1 N-terminal domain-containing protein n=1 Tax=Kolteria novifilia TaxID=2527975 RepID=A0A518B3N1_9BACT|nr:hypothetical protein Pan216_23870 [Planctomycetes bacterium Pan216]